MSDSTSDVYLDASRAAHTAWGYVHTMHPDGLEIAVGMWAENPGHRAAVDAVVVPLRQRIADLEAELARANAERNSWQQSCLGADRQINDLPAWARELRASCAAARPPQRSAPTIVVCCERHPGECWHQMPDGQWVGTDESDWSGNGERYPSLAALVATHGPLVVP